MPIVTIISSRKYGSSARSWNEYLCLAKGKKKRHQIFTGSYELLDLSKNYLNQESGRYDVPQTIGGKTVTDVIGDWVVGGNITFQDLHDQYEFDNLQDEHLLAWILEQNWSVDYEKVVGILI
ncbi:MAG: hypothetical protein ACKOBC_00010 [Hyphomicrobiales bacterium]